MLINFEYLCLILNINNIKISFKYFIIWGLGIGDWAQSPIPNPQSPIPNPQSPIPKFILQFLF